MKNVLSMEFYRLRKNVAFYIINIIIIFLGIISPILTNDIVEDNSSKVEQGFSIIENEYTEIVLRETKLEALLNLFLDGNIMIMIAIIFTSLFAGTYFKNNYEKNIIGALGKRARLPVATFIMIIISLLIFVTMALISTLVGEYFINNESFAIKPTGDVNSFCMFVLTYFFLLVGISSFILTLLQIFRNQLIVLILGLIHGSGLVFSILNLLILSITQKTVISESYILLGKALNLSIYQDNFVNEIISAVFTVIISVALTIYLKQKQDIRT